MRNPLYEMNRQTTDWIGEPTKIAPPVAHYLEGQISGCLNWYLLDLANTEVPAIENSKEVLKAALGGLTETLSDIHWPEHNDQSGDDYSLTDEQWAEIQRRSVEGETLAATKIKAVTTAYAALVDAHSQWTASLRGKIAELDLSIANSITR